MSAISRYRRPKLYGLLALFICFLCSTYSSNAQGVNLLPKGDFEQHNSTPLNRTSIDALANDGVTQDRLVIHGTGWYTISSATPDYLRTDVVPIDNTGLELQVKASCPNPWTPPPASGNAYAYILNTHHENTYTHCKDVVDPTQPYPKGVFKWREYISARIEDANGNPTPLQAGKTYHISFKVMKDRRFDNSYYLKHLGAYLSKEKIDHTGDSPYIYGPLTSYRPQLISTVAHTDIANWETIEGDVYIDSEKEYITIGNFQDDIRLECSAQGHTNVNIGYFIDDVQIVEKVVPECDFFQYDVVRKATSPFGQCCYEITVKNLTGNPWPAFGIKIKMSDGALLQQDWNQNPLFEGNERTIEYCIPTTPNPQKVEISVLSTSLRGFCGTTRTAEGCPIPPDCCNYLYAKLYSVPSSVGNCWNLRVAQEQIAGCEPVRKIEILQDGVTKQIIENNGAPLALATSLNTADNIWNFCLPCEGNISGNITVRFTTVNGLVCDKTLPYQFLCTESYQWLCAAFNSDVTNFLKLRIASVPSIDGRCCWSLYLAQKPEVDWSSLDPAYLSAGISLNGSIVRTFSYAEMQALPTDLENAPAIYTWCEDVGITGSINKQANIFLRYGPPPPQGGWSCNTSITYSCSAGVGTIDCCENIHITPSLSQPANIGECCTLYRITVDMNLPVCPVITGMDIFDMDGNNPNMVRQLVNPVFPLDISVCSINNRRSGTYKFNFYDASGNIVCSKTVEYNCDNCCSKLETFLLQAYDGPAGNCCWDLYIKQNPMPGCDIYSAEITDNGQHITTLQNNGQPLHFAAPSDQFMGPVYRLCKDLHGLGGVSGVYRVIFRDNQGNVVCVKELPYSCGETGGGGPQNPHGKMPSQGNEAGMQQSSMLNVQPNPATADVTINFTLAASGFAKLDICDAYGRVVTSPFAGEQSAGGKSIHYDTSRLAAGMYFLKLVESGRVTTIPLTIVR